ncbi:HlyD family type I secretion periplasmic adaptor subunit [Cognatishimia maritima]|uniref:Membrane fusion protein (MFP) family protein n=1 Tax=Cognatishimia maritima TaxID=870908 RepID=A0A1M5NLE0_9RHOB|nr:HlyD family type I secretion periplasmic adaptor subunit [Cognatishimia maritima]SHG90370.1 HlyD family secretion protein [Cognatishimia maritima]
MPTDTSFSATRYLVVGFLALAALVVGFGTWSIATEISGAVIASGRIEVDRNRQVVQHLDGGVVEQILVDEGDTVAAGDPLIVLDDTLIKSELTILEGQLYELMARRGRLVSERDDADQISFDAELLEAAAKSPEIQDLVDGQSRLFAARKVTLEQEIEQLGKRREQITDQVAGIRAQSDALNRQLELIAEELEDQQSLLDKGLAQATRVLNLLREEARLSGQVGELTASKAQAAGRITEIDIEILKLRTSRREEAITTLRDLQYRELEQLEARNALKERLSRLAIRAPVSGIVYGLNVFAEKSVIRPADPLLFLVPQDRPLVIAAQIEPIHIEQVHVGQDVILRFSTFDQRTTPELNGIVSQVSADIFVDEATQQSYYRAEILVNEGELDKLGENLVLIPGMPVESFLKTDNRTPLAYLVKPFTDYFTKAFRES